MPAMVHGRSSLRSWPERSSPIPNEIGRMGFSVQTIISGTIVPRAQQLQS